MMVKYGRHILQVFVSVAIFIALVGINVIQWNCTRSGQVCLEVKILPVENKCPWETVCCCGTRFCDLCQEDSHPPIRHDFYKVTDVSEVETTLHLIAAFSYLPVEIRQDEYIFLSDATLFLLQEEVDESPPSREALCSYLC